jgi:KaiC/GvpD/RAD55 family RecA-like ATPase
MEAGLIAAGMVVAGVLGALSGLWASEREIEKLDERILEMKRALHQSRLDEIIDSIEREGF